MHGGSTGVTRTEGRARDCSAQTKGSHRAPGSRRLLISECEWKRGEWRLSTDRQRADELVAKKVLERSLSGMTEIACGSKEFAPLSRFPQGQAGAGGFPPRREARCAPRKSAWHASMPPAPPQEGCRPLGDPLRVRWRGGWTGPEQPHVYGSKTAENRPTLEDRLHQNSKLRLLQKKKSRHGVLT